MVLDVGMPKLDGCEVARRIRAESWGRDAVLVALTGWGQDVDRRRSREAGFDMHLVKPVDPATICDMLVSGLGIVRNFFTVRDAAGFRALRN